MPRPNRLLLVSAAAAVFAFMPFPSHAQDADAAATPVVKASPLPHGEKFEQDEEKHEETYLRRRQDWFFKQRAYPLKHIPAGVRQRAIKQRDLKVKAEAARAGSPHSLTAGTQPVWTLVGPQPVNNYYGVSSGRVTSLAVHPTNPKIVYAGGAEGGVWKTTDGGSNWVPLTDGQPSLAIGALTIDPTNSNIIYAGTGEENGSLDSYYGAGVLKSTDGGTTWTQYCGPFCGPEVVNGYGDGGASIGAIAVDPTNNQIVLAGVELYGAHGIYRSTNGGVSWTLVTTDGGIGDAVFFDPANAGVAYAATTTAGVIKSTNHGQTWSASNGSGANVLPSPNGGRIALALAPSSTSVLYIGIQDPNTYGLLGFYKSTDGAASWHQLNNTPDYCGTQCWYDNVIGVSPVNPNVVFLGGSYAYTSGASSALQSLDGGNTWSDQGDPIHPDAHAMVFSADGSILYSGNDGGVWSTTNPTSSSVNWSSLNSTLALTEFYPGISIDPGNINTSLAGTQDNGTNLYTGSLDWPTVDCGDGGATVIDFSTPTTMYTNCIELSLDKSTNGGASFNSATNGINGGDRTLWTPPLVIDPENSQTLYFGTYRVYQTTTAASVWSAISPDLTGNNSNDALSVLAVAPSDSNTVYTGSYYGQLAVTRNAKSGSSATWTSINSSLPNRSVDAVAVDPTTATTAYVGYNGFTGFSDNLGHIFKTTDAGSSWTDISSDLPNTPVDAILVDPDAPDTLYIGTDIGAFYSTNGGASWSTLGTGLPNVVVTGFALHEASRTLRAATHGRSVWDLNLSGLSSGGPAITLTPTSLTFPATTVGTTAGYQLVTVKNTGTATLNLTSFTVTGTNASSFGIRNQTCGSTLAASASCTFYVAFRPGSIGTLTGAISIADNAAGSPQSVALTGTGKGAAVASLTPASLTFPATTVGATAGYQQVTLKNTGSGTLNISSFSVTGTNASSFGIRNQTCGSTLATGASCTFYVAFKPVATGSLTAAIAVTDNAAGSPQTVALSGTGKSNTAPVATLTPTSLTFPSTTVGTTAGYQLVTLKNTGTATLNITSFAVTGPNASSFGIRSQTCGSTLATSASCTFYVAFRPNSTGSLTAAIAVTDNAAGSPQKVALTGTGK